MLYSRWLALGVFIILICIIAIYDKASWKQKVKHYGMIFVEGVMGGIIIDSIGVNAGFYYFPRQPLYSLSYFAIVLPCWGVFGLLINCLWQWLGKEKFVKGMVITLFPLFAYYEGTNLISQSWVYTMPWHFVALGWIPLILTFAGCNRRRKVVFKLETLISQYHGDGYWETSIRVGLKSLRVMLIIVMFPLLITAIVKLIANMPRLKHSGITFKDYVRELTMS